MSDREEEEETDLTTTVTDEPNPPLIEYEPQISLQMNLPDKKKRYLAWNRFGTVVVRKELAFLSVDIDLNEGKRKTVRTHINVYLAALGADAVVLSGMDSSKKGENGETGVLLFYQFNSWALNHDWTQTLPPQEVVESVAIGDNWVAVYTSRRFVRIFSFTSLQLAVFMIPGPIVALVGNGPLIAISYHSGRPSDNADQKLDYLLYNVAQKKQERTGGLPLSPGSQLSWLGFSLNGALIAADTQDIVLEFHEDQWIPIADLRSDERIKDKKPWITQVDSSEITLVLLEENETAPVLGQPQKIITFKHSLLLAESETSRQEAEYLRGELTRSTLNSESDMTKKDVEQDQLLLLLLRSACVAEKAARAFEIAKLLTFSKSQCIAIKTADDLRMVSLAAKIKTYFQSQEAVSSDAITQESNALPNTSATIASSSSEAPKKSLGAALKKRRAE